MSTSRPRRSAAARAPKQSLFEEGSDGEPFDADDDGDGDFALTAADLVDDYDARNAQQQTMWAQAVSASAAAAAQQAGHAGDAAAAVMGLTTLGRGPGDVAIHPGLEFAGTDDLASHQLISAYANAQAVDTDYGIPTQLGDDFVEADFGDEDDKPKGKRKRGADGDGSTESRKISHKGVEAKRRKNINDQIDRIKLLLPSGVLPSTGSVNKADILGHAASSIMEMRNRQTQHAHTCEEYRRELEKLSQEADALRLELSILRA